MGVPGAARPGQLKCSQQGGEEVSEESRDRAGGAVSYSQQLDFIPTAMGSPWRALGRGIISDHLAVWRWAVGG